MRRWFRCFVISVMVAVGALGVDIPDARANPALPQSATDAFSYTGAEQTWSVPTGVTAVHVVLVGAQGGSLGGDISSINGGSGAEVTADVPIPSGQKTVFVEVGGTGTFTTSDYSANTAFNGGGSGPDGGGGASDIRAVSCGSACQTGGDAASLNSRLAVAGGGGGASETYPGHSAGAANGDGIAGGSILDGTPATPTTAGHGPAQSDAENTCMASGDVGGESAGTDGGQGLGGAGYSLFLTGTPTAGGGGSGLYGGGGGAQCYDSPGATAADPEGSGGGGSSGVPAAGAAHVSIATDSTDAAEVIITAPVPATSSLPTISGSAFAGKTLTESHASWTHSPTSFAVHWMRCDAAGTACRPIGTGAVTYTLTSDDVGHTIKAEETASNFYGSSLATGAAGTATSMPTAVVTTKFRAKIGKGHFAHHYAPVTLINRASNVAVTVDVVSVHHSSRHYTVKAGKDRAVHAYIAPHGHSKIEVLDKVGVEPARTFYRK